MFEALSLLFASLFSSSSTPRMPESARERY